jgi:DNA-binding CsgD family transcriptional regulator
VLPRTRSAVVPTVSEVLAAAGSLRMILAGMVSLAMLYNDVGDRRPSGEAVGVSVGAAVAFAILSVALRRWATTIDQHVSPRRAIVLDLGVTATINAAYFAAVGPFSPGLPWYALWFLPVMSSAAAVILLGRSWGLAIGGLLVSADVAMALLAAPAQFAQNLSHIGARAAWVLAFVLLAPVFADLVIGASSRWRGSPTGDSPPRGLPARDVPAEPPTVPSDVPEPEPPDERVLESPGGSSGPVRAAPDPVIACLSERELTVARLVSEGLQDKQIATRLGISTRTVHTYLSRIRGKTGLQSRTQIVRLVVESEQRLLDM